MIDITNKRVVSLMLFLLSLRVCSAEFIDDVRELYESYAVVIGEATELHAEGKADEANALIVNFVPEEQRETAHNFLIGNLLFSYSKEQSYQFHQKAYESDKTNPYLILEYVMQKHRNHEYEEAAKLYQAYLKEMPEDEVRYALLAECQIYLNQYQDAVWSWENSNHGSNHTSIDFAIYEINGKLHPNQRRSDLIGRIRNGEAEIEELILLDLHFDYDWWNENLNVTALEHDLELAHEILGDLPKRLLVIDTYSKARIKAAEQTDNFFSSEDDERKLKSEIAETFKREKIILGEEGELPESSLLASEILGFLNSEGLISKSEITQRFEDALKARAFSGTGDLEALKILGFLYSSDAVKLSEVNELGWSKFKENRFLKSKIMAMAESEDFDSDNELLDVALENFPEDTDFNNLHLRLLNKEGKPILDSLVASIKAEFKEPSYGMIIRDTYRLKSLFSYLKEEIEK